MWLLIPDAKYNTCVNNDTRNTLFCLCEYWYLAWRNTEGVPKFRIPHFALKLSKYIVNHYLLRWHCLKFLFGSHPPGKNVNVLTSLKTFLYPRLPGAKYDSICEYWYLVKSMMLILYYWYLIQIVLLANVSIDTWCKVKLLIWVLILLDLFNPDLTSVI